jgi:DNA-binding transcriptional regulator YhcF (GntR family)
MEKSTVSRYIHLDDHSVTPKYHQLANSIVAAVRNGQLMKDDVLPSINELSFEFEISRDTAEKGYKMLKKMGILGSVPGKGFFIQSVVIDQPLKIFLLFNKLSAHKKIIYDSLVSSLADKAAIDFYIYNNDFALFRKLLNRKLDDYTHYVIIPHFIEGGENAHEEINKLNKSKLILLDKLLPGVSGNFGAVYENFEKDIYSSLEQALPQLSKYHMLKIVFPEHTYFPKEIITGFNRFCDQFAFAHQVVHNMETDRMNKGEVYITLMENDLVTLVERIVNEKWKVGKDIGVISYNETPLKRVILNGITTISTDFEQMGMKVAEVIESKTSSQQAVPFYLNLRPSL